MRRSRESDPYRASASTQAQGAPASSAAAINAQAICGLVTKVISSGTPALDRRLYLPDVWVQDESRAEPRTLTSTPLIVRTASVRKPLTEVLSSTRMLGRAETRLAIVVSRRGRLMERRGSSFWNWARQLLA